MKALQIISNKKKTTSTLSVGFSNLYNRCFEIPHKEVLEKTNFDFEASTDLPKNLTGSFVSNSLIELSHNNVNFFFFLI